MVIGIKKWRCSICGEEIIEGQRFAQLGDAYVHLECVRRITASKLKAIPRDLEAIMDTLEATLYALVRTKEALSYASKSDVREILEKHLSMLEDQALILSIVVEGELRDAGVL